MMSRFLIFLVVLLPVFAGGNSAIGTWNCTSQGGSETRVWTMIVKEDASKLAGVIQLDGSEIPLYKLKMEGNSFTFELSINDKPIVVTTTIDGDKIEGSFKGEEAAGTLKGTRQK